MTTLDIDTYHETEVDMIKCGNLELDRILYSGLSITDDEDDTINVKKEDVDRLIKALHLVKKLGWTQ